jgi:hypothetical protein
MADVKELLVELKLQNEQLIGAVSETKAKMGGLEKQQTRLQKSSKLLKAGYLALAGIITGVVARGLGGLVRKASEAQETLSKFNTVFKDIRREANAVAKNLSRNFGLSALESRRLLSSTGDLLVGFGFTQKSALDLSEQVNKLAVDLASFTNFSGGAAGASDALTKALLGERESVKSLGISILETDVKAKVLDNTTKGLTFETERQAKAYATLQIAQEQSKNAIGDFERTSTSFANQMRILRANLEDFAVKVGAGLLKVFSPFVSILNAILTPAKDIEDITQDLIKSQTEYREVVDKLAKSQGNLSKEEEQNLKIRKELLELDIAKQINELNESFDDQTKKLKFLTFRNKTATNALEQLRSKVTSTKGGIVTLTEAEANLVGMTTQQTAGYAKFTQTAFNRIEVMRRLTNAEVKAQTASKNLTEEDARRDRIITAIAKSIKDRIVTENQLLGLNKTALALVRARLKELPGLELAEKKRQEAERRAELRRRAAEQRERERQQKLKEEAKERARLLKEARKLDLDDFMNINKLKNEALRQAIDEEKALRSELEEFKKIAREGEEDFEVNVFQQKINRINQLLELERISNKQRADLTKARVVLEQQLEQQKLNNMIQTTKSALGAISSLTGESSKTLFALGKAAATAQAIINVAEGVTKAIAQGGVIGPILGAGVAVAGGVQIAKIQAQQPPQVRGFQMGKAGLEPDDLTPRGEDGIIGARTGESILNVQATAQLGREAIDALNAGQGINPQVTINVENGEGAVEVLNDYFKQFGTSERGEAI